VSRRSITLGCVATPDLPPSRILAVAQAAEEGGLAELWLWEDCLNQSAVAIAGAVLGATSILRVGLGVLPVPLRNVALTAMDVASLDGMFPGRIVPGVGHGVQDWMGQVGARAESPLTLLREHVLALRALLRGERLTRHGRYVKLEEAALTWPPVTPPSVYVAGQGPKTLKVVGEVGDGVVFTLGTTPAELQNGLATVQAARSSSRREGPFAVCVFVPLEAHTRQAGARATAEFLSAWSDAGATTIAVVPVGPDGSPEMANVAEIAAWLGTEVRPFVE
jgi:alkanesulfonate monooxygenase SsuD/methylene tetrahydromethanopterin reductase-like flavin-dependent oxidoreductase (luciferase family)